jgi:hypothetical protein
VSFHVHSSAGRRLLVVTVFEDRIETTECSDGSLHPECRIEFVETIVLSKSAVFDLCAGLSDLRELLQGEGHLDHALWVEALFEELEDRIAVS